MNQKHLSLSAAKWTLIAVWSKRILGLISTLYLVKVLTPTDFGYAMAAYLVVGFVEAIFSIGSNQYLIKNQIVNPIVVNTSWTLFILVRSLASIILLLIGLFYLLVENDKNFSYALIVLSILPLLFAAKNPGFVIDEIQDKFKNINLSMVFAKIISTFSTISIAFFFHSYWALILGMVIEAVLIVFFSYLLNSFRPKISFVNYKEQLGFTSKIFVTSIFGFLKSKIDNFIVLKLFGITENGRYTVAQEISGLVVTEVVTPITSGFFSKISSVKYEDRNFTLLFHIFIAWILIIPSFFGLCALKSSIEGIFFNEQWVGIASLFPPLLILSFFALIQNLISKMLILDEKFSVLYVCDFLYILLMLVFYFSGFFDSLVELAFSRIAFLLILISIYLHKSNTNILQINFLLPCIYLIVPSILVYYTAIEIIQINYTSISYFLLAVFTSIAIYLICITILFSILKDRNPYINSVIHLLKGVRN